MPHCRTRHKQKPRNSGLFAAGYRALSKLEIFPMKCTGRQTGTGQEVFQRCPPTGRTAEPYLAFRADAAANFLKPEAALAIGRTAVQANASTLAQLGQVLGIG